GSRERKRGQRRKRKRRSATRTGDGNGAQPAGRGRGAATARPKEGWEKKRPRRSEERNVAARAKLQPLDQGERPTAVTVAAVVSTIFSVLISVQAVLAIANVDAGGANIHPAPLIIFGSVLSVMSVGL